MATVTARDSALDHATPARAPWRLDASMFTFGLIVLLTDLGLSATLPTDPGEMLTRNTVRLSLSWYAAAVCLMMHLRRPTGWRRRPWVG